MDERSACWYRRALWLGYITVVYNLLEGLISIFFGASDDALTLLGFGIDSMIEVVSGIGIVAMIIRIRLDPQTPRSHFERTALYITGGCFHLLAGGLLASAIFNLLRSRKPESSLPGLIISTISVLAMWWLVAAKRKAGRALDSAPILADANCTLVCIYMSLMLMAASFIYMLTGIGFVDALGAVGLAWFSFSEGRETLQKAQGRTCSCEH